MNISRTTRPTVCTAIVSPLLHYPVAHAQDFDHLMRKTRTCVGSHPTAVCLQPDGKILVAGYWTAENKVEHAFVARFHQTTGELDDSFGDRIGNRHSRKGWVKHSSASGDARNWAIAVHPGTGNILVAGSTKVVNSCPFHVLSYTTHGELDVNFGNNGNGILTYGFQNNSFNNANGLILQPDDLSLLLSGFSGNAPKYDFFAAKWTLDGKTKVWASLGSDTTEVDCGRSLVVNPNDGTLLVLGRSSVGADGRRRFAVHEFSKDGTRGMLSIIGQTGADALLGGLFDNANNRLILVGVTPSEYLGNKQNGEIVALSRTNVQSVVQLVPSPFVSQVPPQGHFCSSAVGMLAIGGELRLAGSVWERNSGQKTGVMFLANYGQDLTNPPRISLAQPISTSGDAAFAVASGPDAQNPILSVHPEYSDKRNCCGHDMIVNNLLYFALTT